MTHPVRFVHNARSPRLRYTVAYSFEQRNDGTLDVSYGISQCRRGDTFSRSEGRRIAEARLSKALSGKKAAWHPAMYGKFRMNSDTGLSIGRVVSESFELNRKNVLAMLSKFNLNDEDASFEFEIE